MVFVVDDRGRGTLADALARGTMVVPGAMPVTVADGDVVKMCENFEAVLDDISKACRGSEAGDRAGIALGREDRNLGQWDIERLDHLNRFRLAAERGDMPVLIDGAGI